MAEEEVPRLLRREFGLLYGGLFNKIRFPGRYAVDEAGNVIQGSQWNRSAIDFTGDLGELYAEPDTFYIEGDNDMMIRKRKRNDDGEITEQRNFKVGKLDLAATAAMRAQFATASEIQADVNARIDNGLADLTRSLNSSSVDLDDLKNTLTEVIDATSSAISLEDLEEPLRDRIRDELVSREDVQNLLRSMNLTRDSIDQYVQNQIRDTGTVLGLENQTTRDQVNQQFDREVRALTRRLAEVFEGNNRGLENVRQILSNEYVRSAALAEQLNQYVRTQALDRRLTDFVSVSSLRTEKNSNTIVTNDYLREYTYARETIDTQLRELVRNISGGGTDSATRFGDRLVRLTRDLVRIPRFRNVFARQIADPEQLVLRPVLDAFQRGVTEDLNGYETELQRLRTLANTFTEDFRREGNRLSGRVADVEDLVEGALTDIEGNDTELRNFFQNVVDENQGDIGTLQSQVNVLRATLGYEENFQNNYNADPDDPNLIQVVLGREFAPLVNYCAQWIQYEQADQPPYDLRSLGQLYDGVDGRVNTNSTDIGTIQTNYLDTRNEQQKTDLLNDLDTQINGYTKTEMRTLLDNFKILNFGKRAYWPLRRDWFFINISKLSNSSTISATSRTSGLTVDGKVYKNYDLTPQGDSTERNRWALHNSGNRGTYSPGSAIATIDTTENDDQFVIFWSNPSGGASNAGIYLAYPKRIYLPKNNAEQPSTFTGWPNTETTQIATKAARMEATIEDATGDLTDPSPRHLWRKTIRDWQDYSSTAEKHEKRRIDRVLPYKLGTGSPSVDEFSFNIHVTVAPDTYDYVYPSTD